MKSSIDFLNRALESYKGVAIAEKLGLSSGAVSTWKKRGHISAYYTAKLAELIGSDPKEAIAIAGAEAEPDSEKRAYLLAVVDKMSANFKNLVSRVSPRQTYVLAW